MDAAVFIRRHINLLKDDKPFSIRDFLSYGSRNAVDQAFHRLVKSGRIIRIAQGVFIKETSPQPSALEVALTKARAFGKCLFIHGSQAAFGLKLWANSIVTNETVYACDGVSSVFRFGDRRIRFIHTSARKRNLVNEISLENKITLIDEWRQLAFGNEIKLSDKISLIKDFCFNNNFSRASGLAGLTVSALWYLGKTICSDELVYTARMPFNRHDRQALRELLKVMPAWLSDYFIPKESRKLSNNQKWLIVTSYFP